MRNKLNHVLKEHFRVRLLQIKTEQCYTQEDLAEILHMDRRTVAAILRGEHAMSGLSTALFFVYLVKEPDKEIQSLMKLFQDTIQGSGEESVL